MLNRRAALVTVAGVMGTLYAKPIYASQSQGRIMSLVLDDVQGIEIRYRGRTATVTPGMLIEALQGKGDE